MILIMCHLTSLLHNGFSQHIAYVKEQTKLHKISTLLLEKNETTDKILFIIEKTLTHCIPAFDDPMIIIHLCIYSLGFAAKVR